MNSIEFDVQNGTLYYRCLRLSVEQEFAFVNSDGDDVYRDGQVRIIGWSDWIEVPKQ